MGMTIEDCTKILIAKEKCMERETSGIDTDCNLHNCDDCSLCYEQGTMGEQKEALKFAVDTMRKYQQLQADYENRLNADLVAMLEDLDLQIDELSFSDEEPINITQDYIDEVRSWEYGKKGCKKLIQHKINELRGEENGKTNN